MTKMRVPNSKAKTFGRAPKAGATQTTPSSRRPQAQQVTPMAPDGTHRVPFDEAVTEPRVPFSRPHSKQPPPEAAEGDDDVMSQPQTGTSD